MASCFRPSTSVSFLTLETFVEISSVHIVRKERLKNVQILQLALLYGMT